MSENRFTEPIESKEIRGLSLKTLIWLLGCTASIILFMWRTTSGLQDDIRAVAERVKEMEITKQQQEKYEDLRLRTMELQVSSISVQLKELEKQVNSNTKVIRGTP